MANTVIIYGETPPSISSCVLSSTKWDVADLAVGALAADLDVVSSAAGGQTCRSRVLFLRDLRTNQIAPQQIFVMYTQDASRAINSVFPRDRQCSVMP